MIARTSARPAQAPAAFAEPRQADGTVAPGEGQALTSHTWSLSSGRLSLGFTYRRLESLTAAADNLPAPSAPPAAAPQAKTAAPRSLRHPSFAEMLRRQQLAQLLVEPSRPPADRQALHTARVPAEPQAAPVCRAYAQALGPLAAASRTYTA
ncbi:MAG: hypothetical protein V1797_20345 [Pseudomonadota bacterium]